MSTKDELRQVIDSLTLSIMQGCSEGVALALQIRGHELIAELDRPQGPPREVFRQSSPDAVTERPQPMPDLPHITHDGCFLVTSCAHSGHCGGDPARCWGEGDNV